MSINHVTSDLVSRLRNAYRARKEKIEMQGSKTAVNVVAILKNEGYISGFSIKKTNKISCPILTISLKYNSGIPAISEIEVISKPGKRVYSKINSLPAVFDGLGTLILSTSKGIISDSSARVGSLGGELLIKVF